MRRLPVLEGWRINATVGSCVTSIATTCNKAGFGALGESRATISSNLQDQVPESVRTLRLCIRTERAFGRQSYVEWTGSPEPRPEDGDIRSGSQENDSRPLISRNRASDQ